MREIADVRSDSDPLADSLAGGQAVPVTRRQFLKATGMAGGGLMLAIGLGERGLLGGRFAAAEEATAPARKVYPPAAFVRIGEDESVTIVVGKIEFGQGVLTSMPMLVVEELDCDWSKVRSEHAPADLVYAHPAFGAQFTGGSMSISSSYAQMRTVGASARQMLMMAAAQRWNVSAEKVTTRHGVVLERGGHRSATYGQLAADAMRLPVPTDVKLKTDPKTSTLIGRPTRRLDSPEKVNGSAQFGMDVHLPNMRVAVLARPPVFGGKVLKVDDTRARAVQGVETVLQVPLDRGGTGVAVIGKGYWPAHQGREALDVQWDLPAGPTTASQLEQYRALLSQPGAVARSDGDPNALDGAAKRIEADYEFPYLAHAAMEPLNATADLKADSLTVWSGTQMQTLDQALAARTAGLKPEQVKINTMFAGGGFGRRANPHSDFVVEAVNVAKAMRQAGIEAPVKVIWSREDDMRGGYYRPLHLHRVQVGLDAQSMPLAWRHSRRPIDRERHAVRGDDGEERCGWAVSRGHRRHAVSTAEHARRGAAPGGQRPGAVVALGRAHPYGVRDGNHDRRDGPGRRARPDRVPACRARFEEHAPAGGARAGARQVDVERAAAVRARARRGDPPELRFGGRRGGRGLGRPGPDPRAQGDLRDRLRHRRQSNDGRGAGRLGRRVRPHGSAVRTHHAEGRQGRAEQLPRLPGATIRRNAAGQRSRRPGHRRSDRPR